ncbi:hypothetical protein MTR67_039308 [Solanum verrucosum]|uniref:Uncharacterized protein n=1 Tax=Solanum verrucosum TaxID=315347 RepID=A0AAF0UGP8_SOLVR|nr:hypothetical protein MTR67_039308 [Solanum verrucosum]
MLPPKLQIPET